MKLARKIEIVFWLVLIVSATLVSIEVIKAIYS